MRAVREKHETDLACVKLEDTMENIRQHYRAGTRMERLSDRSKIERLRRNYSWMRTKLDLHEELMTEVFNGQR